MDEEIVGLIHFKDGSTEEILSCTKDEATGTITFGTRLDTYVRIFHSHRQHQYYKFYLNKKWESEYILVNNIDYVELK